MQRLRVTTARLGWIKNQVSLINPLLYYILRGFDFLAAVLASKIRNSLLQMCYEH